MVAHGFKGGTGTSRGSSIRRQGGYTVGVLVQANYGRRDPLRIAGVPVGREITDLMPGRGKTDAGQGRSSSSSRPTPRCCPTSSSGSPGACRWASALMGGRGEDSSGDIFIAFSTANPEAGKTTGTARLTMLPNERINPLFQATVNATEEAIVNAMIAAETMKGIDGNTVHAIPHDRLREVLKKYNRLLK